MTKNQIAQIKKVAEIFNLQYLYIFGSQSRGDIKPLSDFDFGVKFGKKTGRKNYRDKFDLIYHLGKAVGSDKVDVVDMDEANPIINFNIIKDGKTLYSQNENKRVLDKARIIGMYLDRHYYYKRHYAAAIAQMASGNI